MKVCAIQPPYPYTLDAAEATVQFTISQLNACTPDLDLILLPEYSNAPTAYPDAESMRADARRFTPPLLEAAVNAARRCHAIVAVNYAAEINGEWRNTTRVFDRDGNPAGDYYKQQLPWGEVHRKNMSDSYVPFTHQPAIVEVDGLRLAFLICYDSYYNEFVANIARMRPDILLISSHQRSERPDVLENEVCGFAFQCNCFVVRASSSMGPDAETGGNAMIASPEGKILARFHEETGRLACEIGDPKRKYMRSNTFGGKLIDNFRFIEQGRTPWAYRPAGSMVIRNDLQLPYPRICAHRGFNTIAPENSMPAFGAAIALGADEIEFDVHLSSDGVVVSCHDYDLDRVSNGSGPIAEHTYQELLAFDFGVKHGPQFQGLRILTLEQILCAFSRQCIFNLHIKGQKDPARNRPLVEKVAELLYRYDCAEHTYLMTSPDVHRIALEVCPDIRRCMGAFGDPWAIVDNAIECQCQKVQLFKPHFDQALVDKAHANGILCNVFWADDPDEAKRYLDMGIDCILTNDFLRVANATGLLHLKH